MRCTVCLGLMLLSLAACKQQPDFDQRYQDAQRKLDARSVVIEGELSAAQSDAAAADPVPIEAASAQPAR